MRNRHLLFGALGLASSVLPPALCVLFYFPTWLERDVSSVLSGFTLLLLTLAFLPMLRLFRERGKTPSAPVLWGLLFLLFFSLSHIAAEMTVVCFWGFLGNLAGAVFFRLARKWRDERI